MEKQDAFRAVIFFGVFYVYAPDQQEFFLL